MAFFVFWIICVAIAVVLVNKFKRSGWWIFFTALFPITLLLLIASGRKEGKGGFKKCPECEELINYFANICPHCHADQYGKKQSSGKAFATVICPKCRAVNTSDSKKCYNCGKDL